MPIIFADPKKITAIVSAKMDDKIESKAEMDDDMKICEALAADALDAIKSGSASDLAKSLKAFFHHVDSMPHEEGEHY